LKNLFSAWQEFRRGKRSKIDVLAFEEKLERNIFKLHDELVGGKLISEEYFNSSLNSYLGMLKHCHGYKNRAKISGCW
jgi:hypothetical protein